MERASHAAQLWLGYYVDACAAVLVDQESKRLEQFCAWYSYRSSGTLAVDTAACSALVRAAPGFFLSPAFKYFAVIPRSADKLQCVG
jgi:hypothetical protein